MSVLAAGAFLAMQVAVVDTLVVRAENPASGSAELEAVEELRLGSLDGPIETSFGYVESIAVTKDGTMYVPDIQVPAVRVFDRDGTYLGDVGGKGEGPGEYVGIRGIAPLPGGRVAVWHEMGDITVFDRERRFVRRFTIPLGSIAGGPGPGLVADTAGNLFVRTTSTAPTAATQVIPYAWVHYGSEGQFIDSIVPPARDLEGSPFAFRSETFTAPSPHGYFVTGRTSTYAIHRPLRDGRILRIERDHEVIPIEGEERAQWEAYIAEIEARRGDSHPPMHRTKPPWKQFHIGYDGRIWVQRHSPAVHVPGHQTRASTGGGFPTVEWVEPGRHDVLDPRGALLGTVILPSTATILAADGPFVWTLERGSFDEAYVVRYRIEELND